MSYEPFDAKDQKQGTGADNSPISLPPAGTGTVVTSEGGIKDRTVWIVIGVVVVGICFLLLFAANFVSKTMSAFADPPIATFAPTVLPNLTATQRAWIKPAKSPTLAAAQDVAPAVESQNIEYLWMRSSTRPWMPEVNQPGDIYIYEIHLSLSMELIWEYGWCAKTQDALGQNFEQMKVEFRLNGASVGQEHIATREYQRADGGYCRAFIALITDWPQGQHQLESRVTFTRPTDDGWNLYPAGTHIFKYFVNVDD